QPVQLVHRRPPCFLAVIATQSSCRSTRSTANPARSSESVTSRSLAEMTPDTTYQPPSASTRFTSSTKVTMISAKMLATTTLTGSSVDGADSTAPSKSLCMTVT